MNQPMPFEDWREQIRTWAKTGRWDLIKLSAKKRREYENKEIADIKEVFGIKE